MLERCSEVLCSVHGTHFRACLRPRARARARFARVCGKNAPENRAGRFEENITQAGTGGWDDEGDGKGMGRGRGGWARGTEAALVPMLRPSDRFPVVKRNKLHNLQRDNELCTTVQTDISCTFCRVIIKRACRV